STNLSRILRHKTTHTLLRSLKPHFNTHASYLSSTQTQHAAHANSHPLPIPHGNTDPTNPQRRRRRRRSRWRRPHRRRKTRIWRRPCRCCRRWRRWPWRRPRWLRQSVCPGNRYRGGCHRFPALPSDRFVLLEETYSG
ncbi:hypothetical protein BU23DRAFT_316876, partial [Bimuria novae-zelandiae CBS 107.79]